MVQSGGKGPCVEVFEDVGEGFAGLMMWGDGVLWTHVSCKQLENLKELRELVKLGAQWRQGTTA
jgi:hypothetical protein